MIQKSLGAAAFPSDALQISATPSCHGSTAMRHLSSSSPQICKHSIRHTKPGKSNLDPGNNHPTPANRISISRIMIQSRQTAFHFTKYSSFSRIQQWNLPINHPLFATMLRRHSLVIQYLITQASSPAIACKHKAGITPQQVRYHSHPEAGKRVASTKFDKSIYHSGITYLRPH